MALQKCAILVVFPITLTGAIWNITMMSSLALFPFLSMGGYLLGGIAAIGVSRILKSPPQQAGALFSAGYFSNVAAIGGLVCYFFLGEQGFALMTLYRLFDPLSYFVIGFSLVKNYSAQVTSNISLRDRFTQLMRDPFIVMNMLSLLLGAVLNLSGIERPSLYGTVNAFFIPLSTSLILVSIGLTLQFSKIRQYLRECVLVAVIKFVFIPFCLSLTAFFLGYGMLDSGLPLKVVLILSASPVGFTGLIATSLYELDVDLANSCFVFTTSLYLLVLPVLYHVTR